MFFELAVVVVVEVMGARQARRELMTASHKFGGDGVELMTASHKFGGGGGGSQGRGNSQLPVVSSG